MISELELHHLPENTMLYRVSNNLIESIEFVFIQKGRVFVKRQEKGRAFANRRELKGMHVIWKYYACNMYCLSLHDALEQYIQRQINEIKGLQKSIAKAKELVAIEMDSINETIHRQAI